MAQNEDPRRLSSDVLEQRGLIRITRRNENYKGQGTLYYKFDDQGLCRPGTEGYGFVKQDGFHFRQHTDGTQFMILTNGDIHFKGASPGHDLNQYKTLPQLPVFCTTCACDSD